MSLLDCKVCDQGYVFVGTHTEGHDGGHKEYDWKDVYNHIINLFPDNYSLDTLKNYKFTYGGFDENFEISRTPIDGGGYTIYVKDGAHNLGPLYNDGTFEYPGTIPNPNDPNVWMTLKENGKDHGGATSKYIS